MVLRRKQGYKSDGENALVIFTSVDTHRALAIRQTSYLVMGFAMGTLLLWLNTGTATNPPIDGMNIAQQPTAIDYDYLVADINGTLLFKKCYDFNGQPLWVLSIDYETVLPQRLVPALNETGASRTGSHRFGYNRLSHDLFGRTNNRWNRELRGLAPPWLRIADRGARPYDLLFAAWNRTAQSDLVDVGATTIPPMGDNDKWMLICFDVLRDSSGGASAVAIKDGKSGLSRMKQEQDIGALLFRNGMLDVYGTIGIIKRLDFTSANTLDPVYWDTKQLSFSPSDYAPHPVRLAFWVDRIYKVYAIGGDFDVLSVVNVDNIRFHHNGVWHNRINFRDIYLRGLTRMDNALVRGRVEGLSARFENLVVSNITVLGTRN
jgi:hypothetical protein